jgi:hypothetical protein
VGLSYTKSLGGNVYKMKKLLILCLSIFVLSAFAGCSSNVDTVSGTVNNVINTEGTNLSNTDVNAENTTATGTSSTESDNMAGRNDAYQSKQEFLDSADGHSFQIAAYKFAKAFFEKNEKVLRSYLADPDKNFEEYSLDYDFQNVEFMILKLNADDIKEDSVSAQYEFKLDSEDSYTYLQLSIKKVDGQWKIEWYGLEK